MTWGNHVQSFVFLGLLVFELEPMYATSGRQTDKQTDDGRRSPLNVPAPLRGGGIINSEHISINTYSLNKTVDKQFCRLLLENVKVKFRVD